MELKEAVCSKLKRVNRIDCEVGNVLIANGGKQALFNLFMAILNPGDEVIIPEPFYANYNGFAQIADISIQPVPTYIEDGFKLPSLAEFEARITDEAFILEAEPGLRATSRQIRPTLRGRQVACSALNKLRIKLP